MNCRAPGHIAHTMFRILLPMVAAIGPSHTALADDPLAPCNLTADYLRDFAAAHPAQATSEENFPLNALSGQESATSIRFLPLRDFETLETIEAAIAPLKFSPANRQFMDETVYLDLGAGWQVIDARSLGNRLVLIQTGGSASCYQAAIFDTSAGDLKPAYTGNFGEGDVCDGFGTSFDVLRIGDIAYPVLFGGVQEGRAYEFSLRVMPLSGQGINETPDLCRVSVTFGEKMPATSTWASEGAEAGEAVAVISSIAAALEAGEMDDDGVAALLKPYLARPEQPIGDDAFQRLAARNAPEKVQPADLLTGNEEVQLFEALPEKDLPVDSRLLALEIGGAKVIFAYGSRHLGWRYRSYLTLRAWKWWKGYATDLFSADFMTIGRAPVITVQYPDGRAAK